MTMKTIRISDNVTNLRVIGKGEYPNAIQSSLVSVDIGSRCETIGPSCFYECNNLRSVHTSISCTGIGDHAFHGCKSLGDINIIGEENHSLHNIGNNSFEGCDSLEKVNINFAGSGDGRSNEVGEYIFKDCKGLKEASFVKWPYLAGHMFTGCDNLTSINITNSTNYVFPYCFSGIKNIEKIDIPNNTWMISEGMFAGDVNLKTVNIQDTEDHKSVLLGVYNNAFNGCDSLSSLTLPESISSFSQLEPLCLSGSGIKELKFKGLPDSELILQKEEKVELTNFKQGYLYCGEAYNKSKERSRNITSSQCKTLINMCLQQNVPIITVRHSGDASCPYCLDTFTSLSSKKAQYITNKGFVFVYVPTNFLPDSMCKAMGMKTWKGGTYTILAYYWKDKETGRVYSGI